MNFDRNKPIFTKAEVLEITSISSTTFQNWMSRDIGFNAVQKGGTGNRRLFSCNELIRIACVKAISTRLDTSPSKVAPLLGEQLGNWIDKILLASKAEQEFPEIVVVFWLQDNFLQLHYVELQAARDYSSMFDDDGFEFSPITAFGILRLSDICHLIEDDCWELLTSEKSEDELSPQEKNILLLREHFRNTRRDR